MQVLVAVASKHGGTTGIAEAIAETLNQQGIDATLTPIGDIRSIAEYPAVIVESAVCAGRWLKPAKRVSPVPGAGALEAKGVAVLQWARRRPAQTGGGIARV